MYNVQKNQTSEPPNLPQSHGGGVKNTRATQYCESMKIRRSRRFINCRWPLTTASKVVDGRGKLRIRFNDSIEWIWICVVGVVCGFCTIHRGVCGSVWMNK
eukprot:scaffold44159_cov68-Cyclotella_meneghiniana.AAC.5